MKPTLTSFQMKSTPRLSEGGQISKGSPGAQLFNGTPNARLLDTLSHTAPKPLHFKGYFMPMGMGGAGMMMGGGGFIPTPSILSLAPGYEMSFYAAESNPMGTRVNPVVDNNLGIQLSGHDGDAEKINREYAKLLMENNYVQIHGPITSGMAVQVQQTCILLADAIKQMEDKLKPEQKVVKFIIQSPGGSVDAMNSILDSMDMLKNSGIQVMTYANGMVASAATLITANGSPGLRFMAPKCRYMIHQPLGGAQGQATEIEIAYREIQKIKEDMIEFFGRVSKVPKSEIAQRIERDYYMGAEQAAKEGFVDQVLNTFSPEAFGSINARTPLGDLKKPTGTTLAFA